MKIKYLLIALLNIPLIYVVYNYFGNDPSKIGLFLFIFTVMSAIVLFVEFIICIIVTYVFFEDNWDDEYNWINNDIFKFFKRN